jgi:ribosome maturation factor RimP
LNQGRVEERVEGLTLPIAAECGVELVDIEYVKEGAHWYLRIYIDKDGGVTVDDCEAVSLRLSRRLDEADPVSRSYILEVSSPGLERPLKKPADFVRYRGRAVTVTTFAPAGGKKLFSGTLQGLIDDQIVLNVDGEELLIPRIQVSQVRLALE